MTCEERGDVGRVIFSLGERSLTKKGGEKIIGDGAARHYWTLGEIHDH